MRSYTYSGRSHPTVLTGKKTEAESSKEKEKGGDKEIEKDGEVEEEDECSLVSDFHLIVMTHSEVRNR